jgi:hypothetical protein
VAAEEDALQPAAARPRRMLLRVDAVTPLPKVDAQESRPAVDVPVEEEEGPPSHPPMQPKPRRASPIPQRMLRRPIACLPAFQRL